jgi:ubiquinone biosynthesis protein
MRTELGPEAYYADRLIAAVRALKKIPDLIDRLDSHYPPPGAAPPPPPLAEVAVIRPKLGWAYALVALLAAAATAAATMLFA